MTRRAFQLGAARARAQLTGTQTKTAGVMLPALGALGGYVLSAPGDETRGAALGGLGGLGISALLANLFARGRLKKAAFTESLGIPLPGGFGVGIKNRQGAERLDSMLAWAPHGMLERAFENAQSEAPMSHEDFISNELLQDALSSPVEGAGVGALAGLATKGSPRAALIGGALGGAFGLGRHLLGRAHLRTQAHEADLGASVELQDVQRRRRTAREELTKALVLGSAE